MLSRSYGLLAVLQGCSPGVWEEAALRHHASSTHVPPSRLGTHLQPQTRTGRSSTLAVSDVAEKKSISCPFIPFSMPIFCTTLGHIRQNSPLKRGFGYVASRGADPRGDGLTHILLPTCEVCDLLGKPANRTQHPSRGVSSQGSIAAHRRNSRLRGPAEIRVPAPGGGPHARPPGPAHSGLGSEPRRAPAPVRAAAAPLRSRSAVTRARSPGGRGGSASLGDSSSRLPRLPASISRVAPAGAALGPGWMTRRL